MQITFDVVIGIVFRQNGQWFYGIWFVFDAGLKWRFVAVVDWRLEADLRTLNVSSCKKSENKEKKNLNKSQGNVQSTKPCQYRQIVCSEELQNISPTVQ